MNFNKVEFILSAASKKDFIHNELPQVAFAGRSNVGKSSTINRLLNRKNFARVGSAPGKTVHVNYFLIDQQMYLVDLPGYGYAKVSKTEKERWAKLMESYFADPETIDVGVMIVDARHKPTANDVTMADWFKASGAALIVVANKLDKLKKSEIEPNLQTIRDTLELDDTMRLIPFSAEKGTGKEELISAILELTGLDTQSTEAK
jgi:GTP-binding protein